ncbi:hypothetical protein [Methylotenera sp.]|uniref:hypothetical protein n=1 Tax=Methylotenera sp. TaxID=2051956 RepID=UPI0027161471|nr:hypothetical protein [Methylotenera sp.]MDO9205071.1 hypothetical protein [Methylotenera sp.]MDP3817725.1 hypothetical protein [Methylotenera sp.]
MIKNVRGMTMLVPVIVLLSSCATGAGGFDSINFNNAAKVHIFTPEEQSNMTSDGAIPTMITPSELVELSKSAGKVAKPTGHISYCNAGLLSRSARSDALKAIDGACGGKGQFTIVRAVPMLDAVNIAVGVSCTRSEMIIFRCNSAQAKLR